MSSQVNSEQPDTVDVPEYGVRSRSEMACSIHRDHDGDGHLPSCRESEQDVDFTDVHIASHLPFSRWSLCQRPECFGDEGDCIDRGRGIETDGGEPVEHYARDDGSGFPSAFPGIGLGAVLYEDRPDTPEDERRLHHVTDIRISIDTTTVYYVVWDGTHTVRHQYSEDDLLADFEPAGWRWPTSKKPTYWLTRECGVDDVADLMTDGGPSADGIKASSGREQQINPIEALTDAVDKHYDEEHCGAPLGDVVEEMLTVPSIEIGDVGYALREAYFHGVIYQPSESTVARVATDGGQSVDGTERCPICDELLNGETTITSEGKAHEECAGFDDGVDVLPDGGIELAGESRQTRLGPHRVPRIECDQCGHNHHIDAANGEYQGRCAECFGFLRRPTDTEERKFYDFIDWKARHLEAETEHEVER